ncbi:hypothetical protein ACIQMJ_40305 [Actinosynnema sp. NPDC091369]
MLLGEAVDEEVIGANPCRRSRVNTGDHGERPCASPWQARVAAQRCSPADSVLVVTAAYNGALHEVGGRLELEPPKSKAGIRTMHVPPFLVDLLTEHRADRMYDHVFTGLDGGLLRRSNSRRRAWLPFANGDPTRGWAPIHAGSHFHDPSHAQDVAHRGRRAGDFPVQAAGPPDGGHPGTYSHVSQVMVDATLDGLQRRWKRSLVAAQDDPAAGDVVRAVAVLPAGQRPVGALVQTRVVAEPEPVGEARAGHVVTTTRAASVLRLKFVE